MPTCSTLLRFYTFSVNSDIQRAAGKGSVNKKNKKQMYIKAFHQQLKSQLMLTFLSSFSTLRIFLTPPHFPYSPFSILAVFHTSHFPLSALRTPCFPYNLHSPIFSNLRMQTYLLFPGATQFRRKEPNGHLYKPLGEIK